MQSCEQGPWWGFVVFVVFTTFITSLLVFGIYHMTALKSLERDGIDTLHSLPVSHALRMYLEPEGGLLTD